MKIRLVASAAVLISAVIHLKLWFDVFRDENVIGPAMLLNFVGGVVIAVLLISWRHWLPLLLAIGFGASTLGAFLISTTDHGLFGVHERWIGWQVFTSAVVEVIAIVVGLLGLLQERRELSRPRARMR